MNNRIKLYTGILILLVSAVAFFELSRPEPVDWTPTFNETHTKPYGLKVFYTELKSAFKDSVRDVKVSPYEFLSTLYDKENSSYFSNRNYIYIHKEYRPDEVSTQELLSYAASGNTVFIASENISNTLQDSLGFSITYDFSFKQKGRISLANSRVKRDSISVDDGALSSYFYKLDSLNTTVLGYQDFGKERINFVKIRYGKGYFLLHTYPYVFTNYYLLRDDNYKYAEDALAYLGQNAVFFDSRDRKQLGNSPLRFILSQPPLRWAWFIGLLTLLTFMIFNAKRKQRIVQVIQPLPNTTVAFIKTIGNLYYETKDHTNLVDKKITYFLEKIRRDYYLETTDLNDKFVRNLAAKTGRDREVIKKLVDLIIRLQSKPECTEEDLLQLNRAIENFYTHNNERKEKQI
ncbi:DUF4350 domain-containing protein [Sinomicrobium weinanense]|uniref:DUF4350 domain-containing protein n=1 Tax=Sinomicrobium weinanense TaxID=2842200 RepID=A0A926JSH6_9FLAO|nr:DUF4350 domain-containing protein [Sinomicrobium weinanense]MBC9796576.1 DUF4350 domain-containing protein [Sinomicrobium weinanense]MBU3123560.1 DUF4350 domain-containing protein [Sinomicrobium weinanense]